MYNLTFEYLKNFVLLYFWIPDSGFRIPAFRVARLWHLIRWKFSPYLPTELQEYVYTHLYFKREFIRRRYIFRQKVENFANELISV